MNPITKTCNCGATFKVAEDVEWKFADLCGPCIMRAQPYQASNQSHQREDAIIEGIEADAEMVRGV